MTLREIILILFCFILFNIVHAVEVIIMDYDDINYDEVNVYEPYKEREKYQEECYCPEW
jgi:hypothetical protein